MLKGTIVELQDMLACREARVQRQEQYLADFAEQKPTLISFSLNIPGPVKTNTALHKLFEDGLAAIQAVLAEQRVTVLKEEAIAAPTGDEALWAVVGSPEAIKSEMTRLEESLPLGRLFDIDVLNAQGEKLSRAFPRHCLICGEQAQGCARSRKHSVEELTLKIEQLLRDNNY